MTETIERTPGTGTHLWRVIASPTIWAVHFLVCYVAGAIYCEKAGRTAGLDPAKWIVLAATGAALLGIGLVFVSLWRVRGRSVTDDDFTFEANTAEERHRFLSHVALMLSVLSAIAVLLVAIPAFVLTSCR